MTKVRYPRTKDGASYCFPCGCWSMDKSGAFWTITATTTENEFGPVEAALLVSIQLSGLYALRRAHEPHAAR